MQRKCACIFIITIFFLIVSSPFMGEKVLASGEENTTNTVTMVEILENASLIEYITEVEGDGAIIEYKRVIELGKDGTLPVTGKGTLSIGNKEYSLSIKITNDKGEDVVISTGIDTHKYEDTEYSAMELNTTLTRQELKGAELKFVITPIDGTGEPVVISKTMGDFAENPRKDTVKITTWDDLSGVFTGKFDAGKAILELLTRLVVPVGDFFLHMLSLAVGEAVTIDSVVFNRVAKLDINFFNANVSNTSLVDLFTRVVNVWYERFRNIAIAFYLMLFVYIGIRILLASTGSSKADYKKMFTAWVMGIAMLMLFPYVMKYTIELNNAFCKWISVGFFDMQKEIYRTDWCYQY